MNGIAQKGVSFSNRLQYFYPMRYLSSFLIFIFFGSVVTFSNLSHGNKQQIPQEQFDKKNIIVETISNLEISYLQLIPCASSNHHDTDALPTGFVTLRNKNKKSIIINNISLNSNPQFTIREEQIHFQLPFILFPQQQASFRIRHEYCSKINSLSMIGYGKIVSQSSTRATVNIEWFEQVSGPPREAHFLVQMLPFK